MKIKALQNFAVVYPTIVMLFIVMLILMLCRYRLSFLWIVQAVQFYKMACHKLKWLFPNIGTPVVEPEVVDSASDAHRRREKTGNSYLSKICTGFSPGVMDYVKCTACYCKIQPFSMPFSVHPLLKVILCKVSSLICIYSYLH